MATAHEDANIARTGVSGKFFGSTSFPNPGLSDEQGQLSMTGDGLFQTRTQLCHFSFAANEIRG
jgi:hypothetical protein